MRVRRFNRPPVIAPPAPEFASWADYSARTTHGERMIKCCAAAKKANRKFPGVWLSGYDVLAIMLKAEGRCVYCHSLAVEKRPSAPNGAPIAWEHVGRRIGSLEHKNREAGNDRRYLAWACLWCNTHEGERIPYSPDYGGHYPASDVSL